MKPALIIASIALVALPISAQEASIIYRLGNDTIAVEQFTRTPSRLTGEIVRRNPSVSRMQYDITLGPDGRPTSAVIRERQADGSPIPNRATELRLTFRADSVLRENVFADSTQRRTFAAARAMVVLPVPSYAVLELIAAAQRRAPSDSFAAIGTGGVTYVQLQPDRGDTLRLRGGPYAMRLVFDNQGRLLLVDGTLTTNKMIGTRAAGGVDLAALAGRMTPMGPASGRDVARAGFGPGGMVLIDYGRPLVRGRTVWGGVLVPYDDVWRMGANDAAHLFTTRTLAFGEVSIPPGMYTLWLQHTRTGTTLIVNKQTGQWGTLYNAAQDFVRIPLQFGPSAEHVEEFTIAIRSAGGGRGTLELAWGANMATASFLAR